MITGDLKNKIDNIWETFWTGGLANPLSVIEQVTYLLFIKLFDNNQIKKERNAVNVNMKVSHLIILVKILHDYNIKGLELLKV